jgi:hypothetical protein
MWRSKHVSVPFSLLGGFLHPFVLAEAPNSRIVRMLMPVLRLSHTVRAFVRCSEPPGCGSRDRSDVAVGLSGEEDFIHATSLDVIKKTR